MRGMSAALQGATPNGSGPPASHQRSLDGKLSGCVVAVNVLLVVLFYFYMLRVCMKRNSSGTSPSFDNSISDAVVSPLPTFVYAAADEERLECPVCLTEFEAGEVGRLLPGCGHRFHAECIDMWLHSHCSCPLCRSKVELKTTTTPLANAPG